MASFKDVLKEKEKIEAKPVEILTGLENINIPSIEATIEEAEQIWPILEASLDPTKGFGLAAVQIGIPKKVAIIKYNNITYHLLNTKIVKMENLVTIWKEGCLSLPGKIINTERFSNITVQDDVLGKMDLAMSSHGLLPIIFQHEMDHFEGKSMLEHQLKPFVRESKIGRNDPCPCGSGKKYKKCCLNLNK